MKKKYKYHYVISGNGIDESDYEKIYDEVWEKGLNKGISGYGDLELSKEFFKISNIRNKNSTILDIGCGIGSFANSLYESGYNNLKGIDISHHAINYGKKKYPHLDLEYMNAIKLKFDSNYFDICFSFDLIEHLIEISDHFKQVYNILNSTGIYIFQTPNKITNIPISILRHRTLTLWKIYHPSLQYSWSLVKILRKNGFKRVEFFKIPPLSQYKIQQIPKYVRWLLKLISWKKLPLFLQTNFYVKAYK